MKVHRSIAYSIGATDVTANSAVSRLKLHMPNEAEDVLKGRYRFIKSVHIYLRYSSYRVNELINALQYMGSFNNA